MGPGAGGRDSGQYGNHRFQRRQHQRGDTSILPFVGGRWRWCVAHVQLTIQDDVGHIELVESVGDECPSDDVYAWRGELTGCGDEDSMVLTYNKLVNPGLLASQIRANVVNLASGNFGVTQSPQSPTQQ